MTDIRPFTQYSFKVRAYTEGDESPFSEVVTIITEERGTFLTRTHCSHLKMSIAQM